MNGKLQPTFFFLLWYVSKWKDLLNKKKKSRMCLDFDNWDIHMGIVIYIYSEDLSKHTMFGLELK